MASAKKRAEMAMASKKMQSHVQINTHVEDPQKSLEELFSAGMRTHEQKKHYERKPKYSVPLSFNQRPISVKSRGSSAGHSREGSSDDGIGSSGRQTLSPSSVSSNNLGGPYQAPIHTRQGSAPALINYGLGVEHHSNRPLQLPVQVPSKSLSVMAMSEASDNFALPTHRSAKSCDLEVEPSRHLEMSYTPDGQPFYIDHTSKLTFWSDPRAKSQSLDPISITGMSESPMFQPQTIPSSQMQNDPKDGLGPLPEGWMKNFDQNGDPYFIDHINQTTTWYDPRIPQHLQEESIRQRHACGRQSGDQQKRATYGSNQDSSPSLVQQLQMERKDMHERQQQLCREGLLGPQWQNNHSYHSSVSPMQQPQLAQNSVYSPYCSQPQQPVRQDVLSTGYYTHDRTISNDSAVDNTMEIDYMAANTLPMQVMPSAHQIDPAIVQDLTAQDLNPRAFDRYLQLNDNRSPPMAKQYM